MPTSPKPKPGDELYYVEDGKKRDAAIHEVIIAGGDQEAATAVGRKVARSVGLTDAEVAALFPGR